MTYFGEAYTTPNCGNCDNCLNPRERFDAREAVELLIDVVGEFNNRYKPEYIIDFIMGVATDQLKSYGHASHELFGHGADHDRRYWTSVLRQSILSGYISKDIENYGLLRLGPKADEIGKSKASIMFCMDRDFSDADDDEAATQGGTSALDEVALGALKAMRRKMADKLNLPPHVIFSDPALEAIATYYPMTIEELKNIPGVGEGKAHKFGKVVVDFMAKYVEENEIDRPQDSVIKTVANKSKNKVPIIMGVDRKVGLEDLAKSKGLTMPELIKEMEAIVYSGTKLNVDYYLKAQYDQDQIDDVFMYFKEAEDDSMKLAMDELEEDEYPEELIRLVRIKFVSELGN